MPYILDELGNPQSSKNVHQEIDTDPPSSIAWTMDPYAPVPNEYMHLVKDPNEDSTIDEQEEGT